MEIGAHLSRSDLQKTADRLGLTAAQIFLGSPKTWKRPALSPQVVAELQAVKIPFFVHAPYLFNPASANPGVRAGTVKNLQVELDNCALAGAQGLVIHAGQGGKDSTIDETIERWRNLLSKITVSSPIIIENTAGGNTAPGRSVEDFVKLMEALQAYDVEYCIDTCHSWAGNFTLDSLAPTLLRELGKPPKVVHMNGSKAEDLASGRDRHANFTAGLPQTELSLEFAEAVNVPVILETPGDNFFSDVDLLKSRLSD